MIELERTKELAKKYKMNLREVNDKADLGRNSIYNGRIKDQELMHLMQLQMYYTHQPII